jgi:hypothetical protein
VLHTPDSTRLWLLPERNEVWTALALLTDPHEGDYLLEGVLRARRRSLGTTAEWPDCPICECPLNRGHASTECLGFDRAANRSVSRPAIGLPTAQA